MAKISDRQVEQLLPLVNSDQVTPEVKLSKLNDLKSLIKHFNVPEHLVPRLFEICRTSMNVEPLVYTGLSTLAHLVKRVSLQNSGLLVSEFRPTAPVLATHIGDEKERFRLLALQCINDFWRVCPAEVERFIAGILPIEKPKGQIQALRWIADNHRNGSHTTFGSPVTFLLGARDPQVQSEARSVLVQLFQGSPTAAKAELARNLQDASISAQVASSILAEVGYISPASSKGHPAHEGLSKPAAISAAASAEETQANIPQKRISPDGLDRPLTRTVPVKEAPKAAPKTVSSAAAPPKPKPISGPPVTNQEVEKILRDFSAFFEGNESEKNWEGRSKTIAKLRDILQRGAGKSCEKTLGPALRTNADNICKGVKSLRTTLSTEGCLLVQDIATYFSAGLELVQEIIVPVLIDHCASTKKINASNGNQTVQKIFENSSNVSRLCHFLDRAAGDKNVQPRQFATQWTQTLFDYHHSSIDRTNLDIISSVIKKGLTDRDKGVRDGSRAALWELGARWPAKATAIIGSVEEITRRFLLSDPKLPEAASQWFPAESLAKSKPAGRTSMKEALSQLRRQQATSEPAQKATRPPSSQTVRPSSQQGARPSSAAGTAQATSLMSAPVRPMRQKSRVDLASSVTATPQGSRPGSRANGHAAVERTPARSTDEARGQRSLEQSQRSLDHPQRPLSTGRPGPVQDLRSESRSGIPISHGHHELETSPRSHRASPRSKQASPSPQRPLSSGRSTALHRDFHTSEPQAAYSNQGHVVPELVTPKPKLVSPSSRTSPSPQHYHAQNPATPSPGQKTEGHAPEQLQKGTPPPARSVSDSSSLSTASSILSETIQPAYSSSPPVEQHEYEPISRPDPSISRSQGLRQWERAEKEIVPVRGPPTAHPDQVLADAVFKLNNKKMDLHGFRKVAGVSHEKRVPKESNGNPLPDGRWYDADEVGRLLIALCNYISTPTTDFKNLDQKAVIDHKTQAFACLRQLLRNQRELVVSHLAFVMKCTLRLRGDVPDQAHVVAACEQDAEHIASWVPTEELPDLLLSVLAALHEGPHAAKSPRIRLGVTVMTAIVNRMKTESSIPTGIEGPLATFVKDGFTEERVFVRKTIQPFFRLLDESMADRPEFWGLLQDLPPKQRECFAYFKARHA